MAGGKVGPMRALAIVALLAASLRDAAADEPAPRVTTDSREYCAELAGRLDRMPGARDPAVRRMADEGLLLCESGHPRAGVARLRRAIRAAQAHR
jgi:hypothetical protein